MDLGKPNVGSYSCLTMAELELLSMDLIRTKRLSIVQYCLHKLVGIAMSVESLTLVIRPSVTVISTQTFAFMHQHTSFCSKR